MLAGVLLLGMAWGVARAADAYYQLNQRVSFIEGYLGSLDRILRGQ